MLCNNVRMIEEVSTNPIVARLDVARKKLGLSREGLSKEARLDRGYLQKLSDRGADASVRAPTLRRLALAAQIDAEELLDIAFGKTSDAKPPVGAAAKAIFLSDIPILGIAEGSVISSIAPSTDPIGHVARPPGLATVPDAYAIYVRAESMSPRHRSGDLRFIHPHKPPRSGDDVIVQAVNSGGEIEVFIKTFINRADKWLICRQLNPDAEVKFAVEKVKAVHRVMELNELFNA
jgi:phage repressor protein C with HTH and peptisase S24 domain